MSERKHMMSECITGQMARDKARTKAQNGENGIGYGSNCDACGACVTATKVHKFAGPKVLDDARYIQCNLDKTQSGPDISHLN